MAAGSGGCGRVWREPAKKLVTGIATLFTQKRLDSATLDELENLLIASDLGVATAARLTGTLRREKFDQNVTNEEVRTAFAEDIERILQPVAIPLQIDPSRSSHVIPVCGVNGSGKTTTIGKLARQWRDDGKSVWLAAGDTFRAAAIEQLEIRGDRAGATVVSHVQGTDPAAIAFDALQQAYAA